MSDPKIDQLRESGNIEELADYAQWLSNEYDRLIRSFETLNRQNHPMIELKVASDRVFIDSSGQPKYIHQWDSRWCLFYWHPDNHWVSERFISDSELFPDNLTTKQQKLYHDLNDKFMNKFSGWFK